MADLITNPVAPIGETRVVPWAGVNISNYVSADLLQALQDALGFLKDFLSTYNTYLGLAKKYAAFLNVGGGVSPLVVLVQALIDLIEGLLKAGQGHVLFVPIRKIIPDEGPPIVPLTAYDIGRAYDVAPTDAAAILATGDNAYQTLISGAGGNAGFYRTVVESLFDQFDYARPQYYSAQDLIACTVMIAGSQSFVELIRLATAFNRLFRPKTSLLARTIPRPTGLTAKVISVMGANRIGVRLDWTPPPIVVSSIYFPTIQFEVMQYAIIRSTSPKAQRARSVLDFFATNKLTKGLTSIDPQQVHKVIDIGSGSSASYLDNDPTLQVGQTYFYAVAWQVKLIENGKETILDWDLISTPVRTRLRTPPPVGNSQPPDWYTVQPTMMHLLPEVAEWVELLLEKVKVITLGNGNGIGATLSAAINALLKDATEFQARVDYLAMQIAQFKEILSQPFPSLYTTSFVGTGGNLFLLSELANRLADNTDPNRPPYDGQEYVMGLVFVAGGPRVPQIQPLVDFINATANSLAAGQSNPLVAAIIAVDNLVPVPPTITFTDSLKPQTASVPVSVVTPAPIGFDAGGNIIAADAPNNPDIQQVKPTKKDPC